MRFPCEVGEGTGDLVPSLNITLYETGIEAGKGKGKGERRKAEK